MLSAGPAAASRNATAISTNTVAGSTSPTTSHILSRSLLGEATMRTWLLVAALCVSLSSRLTAAEIMASHIPDAPVSFRILSSVSGNCWPSASSAQSAGELILRQSGIELRSKIEHYHISLEFLAFGGRADNSENCLVGWHFTATSFDSTNRYGLQNCCCSRGPEFQQAQTILRNI